jgi:hypothetical protein
MRHPLAPPTGSCRYGSIAEQPGSSREDLTAHEVVVPAVGLILFGILISRGSTILASAIPRSIYFETSFNFAPAQQFPLSFAVVLVSIALVLGLLTLAGGRGLDWRQIDTIGGLRWPIFATALALSWAYAGYPYNYYLDQSHVWDRWLLVFLTFGILRSPAFIPFFLLEVVVGRTQFRHPISELGLIGDELPIRIIGIVFGCLVWNAVLDALSTNRTSWRLPRRIPTASLVWAMLCLIGFYYAYAGQGKVMLGATPLDWVTFGHTENLFVAGYLNGWLTFLSEARVLALAEVVGLLSIPISVSTLCIELGMALILLRQRGTLLLLAAAIAMHLGIVITSGIFFWKWASLDLGLLVWLWMKRDHIDMAAAYSIPKFAASLFVIVAIAVGLGSSPFAWWNTKWTRLYEVEVRDTSGETYLVDFADFSPYVLFDLYEPVDHRVRTFVYANTVNQGLMQAIERVDLDNVRRARAASDGAKKEGRAEQRQRRIFSEFVTRYFENRNHHPGRSVPPFLLQSPAQYNRHLSAANLYRDQAPVVEVQLRFREIYYSGTALERVNDEIVYSVPIKQGLD